MCDGNVIKPIHVYNNRQEHSHTIVINNQAGANVAKYANNEDFGQSMHNSGGQNMYFFDHGILLENQWAKIAYIQGSPDQEISGYYICIEDKNNCVDCLLPYAH